MDSSGIHALCEAARTLGDRGCIIVHGAQGSVARVLEMTQIGLRPNIHLIDCDVLAAEMAPARESTVTVMANDGDFQGADGTEPGARSASGPSRMSVGRNRDTRSLAAFVSGGPHGLRH